MISIIAYISMFLDHIGQVFFPDINIYRIIGRLALPLFAYGVAKGYNKTSNFKLYCVRILFIASLSQIPYFLLFDNNLLNICFALVAGLLILRIVDAKMHIGLKIIFILSLCIISDLKLEYGLYGVLSILIFSKVKNMSLIFLLQFTLILMSTFVYNYHSIQFVSIKPPNQLGHFQNK